MARPRNATPTYEPTEASKALKLRRVELGKSQADVAFDSDVLTQTTVSELERGKYSPADLTATRLAALAKGLNWSVAELERATGLDLGLSPADKILDFLETRFPGIISNDPNQSAIDLVKMGAEPINGEYPVPLLGDVAAGGRMDTFIPVENAEEWIDAGRGLAMRYGLSNLYALRVTGDSMYSERARFSVPDNSIVIVHRELEPVRGDIVVAYIEELDVGVIKSFGEPEDATLSSYNPTGPVYRANQYRIRLCGVVVETRSVPLTRRNGFH